MRSRHSFTPAPDRVFFSRSAMRNTRLVWGFTLVELLIVIGVLAILTVAIVVILNPAELLRQARDSQRIQDLTALEKTIQLLETQDPGVFDGIAITSVYVSLPDTDSGCDSWDLPDLPAGFTGYVCTHPDDYRRSDGNGWIPINFNTTFSSLPALPIDPINTAANGYYYTLVMGGSFEVNALLESDKYRIQTTTDGGDSFSVYEKGNDKALTPFSDAGLVGYWSFDEGAGAYVYDGSGNGNTGLFVSAPTWQTEESCVSGPCLSFDGTDDYINAGMDSSLAVPEDLTIMYWINPSDLSESPLRRSAVGYRHGGFLTLNGASFGYEGASTENGWGNNFYTGNILSTGIFQHIAVSYTADGMAYLYLNGEEVASKEVVGGHDSYGSCFFLIGSESLCGYGDIPYYSGLMDDVRVYNRALSAAEIQAIYNSSR